MYSVIGPEPKFQAQLIYQAAVIMNVAGLDWTMPATPGWDNSDMAMFTGDNELMGRIKRVHFETAMRLKVKKIVMGECGHAFRSVYDVGNRWLGWRMPPIPIVHAIDFYHDLLKTGRLKVAKKFEEPVTLHDPCNVVRGGGLADKARYVVNAICENFIEMHPNREHNYLLQRRRRGHQRRAALQNGPHRGQPRQGRTALRGEGQGRDGADHAVSQLPQRSRGHQPSLPHRL